MITVIDYGVGNLFSLCSSLQAIGQTVQISGDCSKVAQADRLILPGVGAFGDAAKKLRQSGLDRIICERARDGVPILGICLGMQLLFDKSMEYGEHAGLSLIPGQVIPMAGRLPQDHKIPHIGWNSLQFRRRHPLFRDVSEGAYVYFVHSFYASECSEDTVAVTEYGIPLTAAVARGNVMGCQFHPEKSGSVGLSILRAFCEESFS